MGRLYLSYQTVLFFWSVLSMPPSTELAEALERMRLRQVNIGAVNV